MEQRIQDLNRKLQEKMRQRVQLTSNCRLDPNVSVHNYKQSDSNQMLGAKMETRSRYDMVHNNEECSDSGVHTSTATRSSRTSPSENEV